MRKALFFATQIYKNTRMMKKRILLQTVAFAVVFILAINCIYTIIYRFTEPHPATHWLPLYDWIYNHTKE